MVVQWEQLARQDPVVLRVQQGVQEQRVRLVQVALAVQAALQELGLQGLLGLRALQVRQALLVRVLQALRDRQDPQEQQVVVDYMFRKLRYLAEHHLHLGQI